MSATIRAALSLFILIGFFVFALALVAGLMFVGFFIAQSFSAAAAVKIFVVAAVAAIGLVVGLGTVLFVRPQPKPGFDVTSEDAPELWGLVTELSHAAGTRGPEQIRLVSEVNAPSAVAAAR